MKIVPEIKFSKRYKRISIGLNHMGRPVLRLPSRNYLDEAIKFFKKNYQFVDDLVKDSNKRRESLAKINFEFKDGDNITLFGKDDFKLEVVESKKVTFYIDDESKLVRVFMPIGANLSLILKKFYIETARGEFESCVDFYTQKLGVSYNKISIKDTFTRWGSCSSKRNLNFSFRLVFAPKEVFEYIVVHEVCHLVEMNHSANYWALVKSLMPNYKLHHDWLHKNGYLLKMYLNS